MITRYLKKKEIIKFQELVSKHYNKKSILSQSKKLINFYYNYHNLRETNIVGVFDKKKLLGALGLIPYKNWDRKLSKDFFIAFWVKSHILHSSLDVFKFIFLKVKPKFLATSGINLNTSGKIFGFFSKINLYNNYFIRNDLIRNKVSKNLKNKNFKSKNKLKLKFSVEKKLSQIPKSKYYPKKSLSYFNKKYLKNPFYNYFLLKFYYKNKIAFFFVCRRINVKKKLSKIIRIVDFYGNIKKNYFIKDLLEKFIKKKKYEYIDFLSYGLDKELQSLGFTKKTKKMFIPENFEPFQQKGFKNYCIIKNYIKGRVVLVKGDGDGDRPNSL
tara:strand:+ start:1020 stop:2000 length:981 start_codon:yes stop_codon:yes gene_type:complete